MKTGLLPIMVHGKWLTSQMWYHHINKDHILSDSPLVDDEMLHHAVSYEPTLWYVDLYGKVNREGVYQHFDRQQYFYSPLLLGS